MMDGSWNRYNLLLTTVKVSSFLISSISLPNRGKRSLFPLLLPHKVFAIL